MTAHKQWSIVEIDMVQDTIQLGVKKPQSKSLSCANLRGFFYWWQRDSVGMIGVYCNLSYAEIRSSDGGCPARQAPNFSDNLCQQRAAENVAPRKQDPNIVSNTKEPACWLFFYDIPSQKRL